MVKKGIWAGGGLAATRHSWKMRWALPLRTASR
jgi:transposase